MGSNICVSSAIWDLHIHSNQCTKPDKELSKLSIEEYVDRFLEVISDHPELEMVSFTDHNVISEELYREFYARNAHVKLLAGIEIDMKLTEDGGSKHLVAYFDCMNDDGRLASLCFGVNSIMSKHCVSSDNPIYIHTLFSELLDLGFKFVVSPHAFKQDKRAIDWDWHVAGGAAPNIQKYADQFFAFWETSGASQIARAIEYLKMMDCEDRESIVSFSDSKDFDKLKRYLNNPPQFFAALPNFVGLQMVGSEVSRITGAPIVVREDERGKYLGSIAVGEQEIGLSPRLNAIIGGRGSGKSVLLDRLAMALDRSKCEASLDGKDRLEFLETVIPDVQCLSGQAVVPGAFQFDFYNQSYVSSLFQSKGEEFNKQLKVYFKLAFDLVEDVETESVRSSNSARFNELVKSLASESADNLVDFVGKYGIDRDERLSLRIPKAPTSTSVRSRASIDYGQLRDKLEKAFAKDVPEFLRENKDVSDAFVAYERAVIEVAHSARVGYLEGDFLHILLDSKVRAKKAELSEASKSRQNSIDSFKKAFVGETHDAKCRTHLIRAYFVMQQEMKLHFENQIFADGEIPEAFCFKKELDIQSPLDFLIACLDEFLLADVGKGKCCKVNLLAFIDAFRFGDERYKSGKTAEELEEKLKSFELSYRETSSIWYKSEPELEHENIAVKSPGTRTNILLEYIVHRNTNVPLLIDQPEDNVDNQTIYGQIKNWFVSLKSKRQVIVVTHDANIVINADAENVVIASQNLDGSFSYVNGALEYLDMLDQSSMILDGGVEAVRRRLMKYGG